MSTQQPPAGRRIAARLARQPLSRLGMGVGAIVLAVSGAFGGLEPAQISPVPTAVLDQPIEAGPWRVTVLRAQLHADLSPVARLSDEANHWLAVVALIEVTGAETWSGLDSIIVLSGVDGVQSPRAKRVLLKRDFTSVNRLHPGMPEEVVLLWEQSAQAVPPLQLTLHVNGRTHRLDSLTHRLEWKPEDQPRATLVVPVDDRREQA